MIGGGGVGVGVGVGEVGLLPLQPTSTRSRPIASVDDGVAPIRRIRLASAKLYRIPLYYSGIEVHVRHCQVDEYGA
jgi:hypothetical protein